MLTPAEIICQESYLGQVPLFPSFANQPAYYYPHFMSSFHHYIFLYCWMCEVLAESCPHDAAKPAQSSCPDQCWQGFRLENREYITRLIASAKRIMAIGISALDNTTYNKGLQHHAVDHQRSSLRASFPNTPSSCRIQCSARPRLYLWA